jgi:hypothetical protein
MVLSVYVVILSASSSLSLAIKSGIDDVSGRIDQVSEGVKSVEIHLSSESNNSVSRIKILTCFRAKERRNLILALAIDLRKQAQ